MANEVVINVGAHLQLVQSSVDAVKKTLDNLQPKTARYKELERILKALEKEMTSLQTQTTKTFSDKSQFTRANKSVDKIEESLIAAKLAMSKLNFDDLKLSGKSAEEFNNLVKNINDAEAALNKLKTQTFFEGLGDDAKKALKSIDPNYLLKDLNTIEKEVDQKLKAVNEKVANADKKYQEAHQKAVSARAINTVKNIDNFGNSGIQQFLQEAGSKINLEDFLKINSAGNFEGFKRGQRDAFFLAIQDLFQLNDSQVGQIKQYVGKQVKQIFQDIQNMDLKADSVSAGKAEEAAQKNLTQLQNEQANYSGLEARILNIDEIVKQSQAYKELQQQVVILQQQLEKLKNRELENARAGKELSKTEEAYKRGLQGMRSELQQTSAQFLKFQNAQRTFQNIKMAVTNFFGFYQVLNLVRGAVNNAMNHIKQLDATMNGIAVVSGQTTAELWKQVDVYTEIAQKYGTTIQGAYEVSKIYYQAGYQTNEVLTLMDETLKLSKISGIDYAQTTDYMMTAIRGFHLEVSEASHVVDVYSSLAAHTAVSQAELAEAITRTASSMEGVGATFEQTSAMIATTVAATRESASNIGSAMKSIASRYGELKTDPSKLVDTEGEALSFNKVDTALRSVGISMRTAEGEFRNFADVILELSDIWDTLDSTSQRYIATIMA